MINELQSDDSQEEYFSERLPQILGSKGLLMTNTKFKGKLIDNEDYIYIDNNTNWLGKIYDIIYHTSNYDFIRENGYQKALKYYQWNNWAEKIDSFIQK
jgi:spore maturation protein CgeB